MIRLYDGGVYLVNGRELVPEQEAEKVRTLCGRNADRAEDRKGTIAWSILKAHNLAPDMEHLRLRFDAMASHDITFVGIIQTAKASGMEKFPLPYVLTNCHNSLAAVGGTINEDDHMFGLSAAKKYGGIYVPPHMAVIHQYMREMHAGCGKMILGSDSHTRYGALGTMAIGEGGGDAAHQRLGGVDLILARLGAGEVDLEGLAALALDVGDQVVAFLERADDGAVEGCGDNVAALVVGMVAGNLGPAWRQDAQHPLCHEASSHMTRRKVVSAHH